MKKHPDAADVALFAILLQNVYNGPTAAGFFTQSLVQMSLQLSFSYIVTKETRSIYDKVTGVASQVADGAYRAYHQAIKMRTLFAEQKNALLAAELDAVFFPNDMMIDASPLL